MVMVTRFGTNRTSLQVHSRLRVAKLWKRAASGPKVLVIGCCKNLTVTSPEIMGRIGWASCQTEQGWAEWYGHVRPKFDQKNMSRKSLL